MHQTTTLGADFARALAAKDVAAIRELIHPEIDFRGLTPSCAWEASDREELISILLESWFEPTDEIEALESVESDTIADRERVGYRFSVTNPDGRHLVEQQAYLSDRDGQIGWMRVVCSGFRPAERRASQLTVPERQIPLPAIATAALSLPFASLLANLKGSGNTGLP
jgi:hypothetical protein